MMMESRTVPGIPGEIKLPGGKMANPAVVLGLFETGLAVGRSLGRAGIRVIGLDARKKVGFYSRYIQASICPHPIEQEKDFVSYLRELSRGQKTRPVLFVTSDEFLLPVSRNREELEPHFLINLPDPNLIERIIDKSRLCELAASVGVPVPLTFVASTMDQLLAIQDKLRFPAFIKGAEVTEWRKVMGVTSKGIVVETPGELIEAFEIIFGRGIGGLVQEIIPGPDTNHYKASCYLSRAGEVQLAFGLQKIRQQPAGFGFGCLVQSIAYPELLALGVDFLTKIGYRGVGSVEFKHDPRDGKLKLIELNPRYWQQNALAEKCGMNFPVFHYLDVTGCNPKPAHEFVPGIKWVNIYRDLDSFREYRQRGQLTLMKWLGSLRGPKVYSDFAWDDPVPGLRELILKNILFRSIHFIKNASRVRPLRDTRPVEVRAKRP